jgi:Tfp pilus assembly PilM family ATPase
MGIFKLKLPNSAIIISTDFIGGVKITREKGGFALRKTFFAASSYISLDVDTSDGLDKERVKETVSQLLDDWGEPLAKVSLVLSDSLVRIMLLNGLNEVPKKKQELIALIKWMAEKKFSLSPDDFYLDFQRLPGNRFLLAAAEKALIDQLVEVFLSLSLQPGWIIPESFGLMNYIHYLLPSSKGVDTMMINLGRRYLSLSISREENLLLFRRRAIDASKRKELIRELSSTILYYQENLEPNERLRVIVGGVNSLSLYPVIKDGIAQEVSLLNPPSFLPSEEQEEIIPLLGAVGAALEGVM